MHRCYGLIHFLIMPSQGIINLLNALDKLTKNALILFPLLDQEISPLLIPDVLRRLIALCPLQNKPNKYANNRNLGKDLYQLGWHRLAAAFRRWIRHRFRNPASQGFAGLVHSDRGEWHDQPENQDRKPTRKVHRDA